MLYDAKRWDKPEVLPLEKWQQMLLDAADLIERRGHCKGTYSIGGAYCVEGAIFAAYRANKNDEALNLALRKLTDFVGRHPPNWNDVPERTAEEVIAAMRAAANQ